MKTKTRCDAPFFRWISFWGKPAKLKHCSPGQDIPHTGIWTHATWVLIGSYHLAHMPPTYLSHLNLFQWSWNSRPSRECPWSLNFRSRCSRLLSKDLQSWVFVKSLYWRLVDIRKVHSLSKENTLSGIFIQNGVQKATLPQKHADMVLSLQLFDNEKLALRRGSTEKNVTSLLNIR